jgi:hypothetical protein
MITTKEILIDVDPDDEEPRTWKEWIVIEGFSDYENIMISTQYQEQDRPRQLQEINDDVLLIPKRNLKDFIKALTQMQYQFEMESIQAKCHNK